MRNLQLHRYSKRPMMVTAGQITRECLLEMARWCTGSIVYDPVLNQDTLLITTPEGKKAGRIGEWVIQDGMGNFYPCPAETFQKSYKQEASENTV